MMAGVVAALGAMSGTSLDGVDAATLVTDGESVLAFGPTAYRPYDEGERATLRAALGRAFEQHPARGALLLRQNGAGAVAQPLGIFQRAKFLRQRDADVGVRADTERAARLQKPPPVEDPVPKVRFRDRTKPRHRPGAGHRLRLRRLHLRGMDQAPALIHSGIVEQPAHRAGTAMGQNLLHLRHLLVALVTTAAAFLAMTLARDADLPRLVRLVAAGGAAGATWLLLATALPNLLGDELTWLLSILKSRLAK